MSEIAIVGAGLAGLVAAKRLHDAGQQVRIYETHAVPGGQIHTELSRGFVVEHGAEGFIATSDAVCKLAEELGLGDELVGQRSSRTYAYDGAFHELAPGKAASFLGFQVKRSDTGKGLKSFRRGMGSLISALVGSLPADSLRCGHTLRGLRLEPGERPLLQFDSDAVQPSQLVLALPSRAAAALLQPSLGAPASELMQAPLLSNVNVTLAYRRDAVHHPLDGTGFVLAEAQQQHGLRACTFVSSKFADRAPPDCVSLRGFYRPEAGALGTLDDAAWTQRAHGQLAAILGILEPPLHAWVARWPDALPLLDGPQQQRVEALSEALAPRAAALAGAAYHGVGIDGAVRSAERLAAGLE